MNNLSDASFALRYHSPKGDQILFNRGYVNVYSYLLRQPHYVIELLNEDTMVNKVSREDCFRADWRLPHLFSPRLEDYKGEKGFDCGHLVPSGDQKNDERNNEETFLLSNMSPQYSVFNRGIWAKLECYVRAQYNCSMRLYVISGPLFQLHKVTETIGKKVKIIVPHCYFKSILAEDSKGRIKLISYVLPNLSHEIKEPLENFVVSTREIEISTGILLWNKLQGPEIETMKKEVATF